MQLIGEYHFQLTAGDFDVCDRIRPITILDLFQEAASRHAHENHIGYEDLMPKNIIWVLAASHYILEQPIPLSSEVIVRTWMHPNGYVETIRDFEIVSPHGKRYVRGTSKWCILDFRTKRILPMRQIEVHGEYIQEFAFQHPLEKISIKDDLIIYKKESYQIKPSDLDHNQHMNNTRYSELLYNLLRLQKDEEIVELRTDYIMQLFLDDLVDLTLYQDQEDYILLGEKNKKKAFIMRCKVEKNDSVDR